MAFDLPSHHRALVLEDRKDGFQVKEVLTPTPTHGSAIVRILSAGILSYHREIYNGQRQYPFPTPIVGGTSAIGRIVAPGPDATALKPGQLVYCDCVIRARDDPSAIFLTATHAGSADGSQKLMRDVWRDGNFAEYAKVPLENCIALDEARLCGELGYTHHDLMYLVYLLVAYGGLRDIEVQVAVSMGAKVIAMGRNEKELARLKEYVRSGTPGASIETVKITGEQEVDTKAIAAFGPIDAILDLTPPVATKSTHLKSALLSLKYEGRISLMGFVDFSVSEWQVVKDNITLKGKLMYSREDMVQFVKILEKGMLPKGDKLVDVKTYSLEQWREAFDVAAEHTGLGKLVVLVPS